MSSEKNEATVLFTQYAEEVGRYLPRRKRKDIQMEILSLLEDALEDQSASVDRAPDEEMAIEVLKTFGPPITFAENYHQNRTLIGPTFFPLFQYALYVVMAVFVLQFVIGLFLPLNGKSPDLLGTLDGFIDKGFQYFGVLVFIFALLERTLERTVPESWTRWPFREMQRTWDPAGLKPDKRKLAVRPGGLWFEVFFLTGAIVLFAVFPHWVGFGNNREGVWGFVPVLSEAFGTYLPWLLGYFLVKIVFNVALSRQAFWDQRMRLVAMGVKVYALILLVAFLTGPDVFGLNAAYLAMHASPTEMVNWFASTVQDWNAGFRIYVTFMFFVQLIGLLRLAFKAILGREVATFRPR